MKDNISKIETRLAKEINKSLKYNDVPVGAVIVCNNKIIASSHNVREKHCDILGHAEIKCIQKACKKKKTWHLNDCIMYVTLKPCLMCDNVIKNVRLKKVVYYLEKNKQKKEYNKTEYELLDNLFSNNIKQKLSEFFKIKRSDK